MEKRFKYFGYFQRSTERERERKDLILFFFINDEIETKRLYIFEWMDLLVLFFKIDRFRRNDINRSISFSLLSKISKHHGGN